MFIGVICILYSMMHTSVSFSNKSVIEIMKNVFYSTNFTNMMIWLTQ